MNSRPITARCIGLALAIGVAGAYVLAAWLDCGAQPADVLCLAPLAFAGGHHG